MRSFHIYTPQGKRSPEGSVLVVDGHRSRLKIEWASFEGSGSTERWNEDGSLIAYREDALLLAAFDGVTAIPGAKLHNGGHWASKLARGGCLRAFMEGAREPADLLLSGNAMIRHFSLGHEIAPGDPLETLGSTGTLVYLDFERRTLLYGSIGDSALVIKRPGRPAEKVTGNLVASFEERAMSKLRAAADADKERSEAGSSFWRTVAGNRGFQNAPGGQGYGVLNGMDDDLVRPYVETPRQPIPLDETESVVLFTDGVVLNERPEAPNKWQRFVYDISCVGALPYIEHVRRLEEQDPQRQRYPRVKLHDDATLIVAHFEPLPA